MTALKFFKTLDLWKNSSGSLRVTADAAFSYAEQIAVRHGGLWLVNTEFFSRTTSKHVSLLKKHLKAQNVVMVNSRDEVRCVATALAAAKARAALTQTALETASARRWWKVHDELTELKHSIDLLERHGRNNNMETITREELEQQFKDAYSEAYPARPGKRPSGEVFEERDEMGFHVGVEEHIADKLSLGLIKEIEGEDDVWELVDIYAPTKK